MTDAEFDRKFRDCLAFGQRPWSEDAITAILTSANGLQHLRDIRELTSLFH